MEIEKLNLAPRTVKTLKKNKILTSEDLATLFPRTYRNYIRTYAAKEAPVGEYCAVLCVLDSCESCRGKRAYLKLRAHTPGDREDAFSVFLFGESYRYAEYRSYINRQIIICGKPTVDQRFGRSIDAVEHIEPADTFKTGIRPVYKKFTGISKEMLQRLVADAVSVQPEVLEAGVRREFDISSYSSTLEKIHTPVTLKDPEEGRAEICLLDLIYFCLLLYGDGEKQAESSFLFKKWNATRDFIKTLPYSLTKDQLAVLNRIVLNAQKGRRNNILLQGDVGCGKTIVAVCAMCCAMENGYQSVLMAPREVLAKQHYEDILKYADKIGAKVAFLHSGMKAAERRTALTGIRKGAVHFIIGTHSCISSDVEYRKLGLIITDEEHLFGVKQKEDLEQKAKKGVHCISMSATPIPRSLATVLYGNDREIFAIRTMPPGRLPVKTCAVRGHRGVFKEIVKQTQAGHRTYVVCPAIDRNEESGITNVEDVEKKYRAALEPFGIRIGVVHGKMKTKDMERTVAAFAAGDSDVLISTTVIEVGVNIPEAVLMVVEQADRFGLATLHQLRGRVGRGSLQSYCVLITDKLQESRIQTMCKTTDGFKIAEADMKIRGMGNLIGTEQSGMNRYVEEMLQNPEIFSKAKQIAAFCSANHYGNYLIDMYDCMHLKK